jgi:hypothetical protein
MDDETLTGRHDMVRAWCASVQRMLAFTLLLLALVGYGSLPSHPPVPILHAQFAQSVVTLTTTDRERVVAPQQADEHRSRQIVGDLSDPDGADPATCPSAPKAPCLAASLRPSAVPPAQLHVQRAFSPNPRAPPSSSLA